MAEDLAKKTIECFRNRLKQLIQVRPVLDTLDFLTNEQKESIKAKEQNEGNLKAVEVLLHEIIYKTYPDGWFRTFITALEISGCKQAANYMDNKFPSPVMEAENDICIKLIDLLQLTLVTMKTNDVCEACYQRNILTHEDCENVSTTDHRTTSL